MPGELTHSCRAAQYRLVSSKQVRLREKQLSVPVQGSGAEAESPQAPTDTDVSLGSIPCRAVQSVVHLQYLLSNDLVIKVIFLIGSFFAITGTSANEYSPSGHRCSK